MEAVASPEAHFGFSVITSKMATMEAVVAMAEQIRYGFIGFRIRPMRFFRIHERTFIELRNGK
jgi:hypothetical protein